VVGKLNIVRKILVVTPVLNSVSLIEETIQCVLNQSAFISGRAELEYIIVDGGSTDGTLQLIEKYSQIKLIRGPDKGIYDALRKAYETTDYLFEWTGYLNSGDLWQPYAVDAVLEIAQQYPQVKWMTGLPSGITPKGYFAIIRQPSTYRRRLISNGIYGRSLPPIQQESTFWHASVMAEVSLKRLATFKLAGDFFLWHTFAKKTQLWTINVLLGGFRMHPGHLSADKIGYALEAKSIQKSNWIAILHGELEALRWTLPDRFIRALGGKYMLSFDPISHTWKSPSMKLFSRLKLFQ
jgi:glycosyltransferase involved in cell wall biosynthesis